MIGLRFSCAGKADAPFDAPTKIGLFRIGIGDQQDTQSLLRRWLACEFTTPSYAVLSNYPSSLQYSFYLMSITDLYAEAPRLTHHVFPPYGRCIYCGNTQDLRTEHIVPYALGGNLQLPKSTCKECADRTSKIEMAVLRGELWAVRVYRELQSRRKHEGAPKSYPLNITRNGQKQQVELPIDEYPVVLNFPVFPPPRILTSADKRPGIDIRGFDTIAFGPSPQDAMKRLGAQSFGATLPQRPAEFARMIAKIAYAMATATGALDVLAEPSELPAMILGRNEAIGHFVGTIDEPNASHPELHRVFVVEDRGRGLLIGDVQLFSDSQTPRYGVVIGQLAPLADS